MKFEKKSLFWIREADQSDVTDDRITIYTQPKTDLWQRTYYGFQNDNAPVLQMKTSEKYFSFIVKTEFDSKARFDQCGIVVYLDSENWMKASIEYENEQYQRLGSVVTNHGYSDWATTDIDASVKSMWYRLSRRESDYWEIAFYKKNSGYLCPVWSAKGCLTAFQIRLDVPYQKRKYVWLSSAKLNKGCSPGSPVSLSGSPEVRRVFVTEGILKAEITHQRTRETYIGNPGVMNHKELKQMLIQLKEQGLREVVEANDMDKLMRLDCREDYGTICRTCSASGSECPKKKEKREQIRKGCIRLYEICEELSLSCSRAAWDTDEEGMWQEQYKGIDDWELQEPEDSYGNMAA